LEAERGRRMVATKLVNLMDGYFEDHYPRQAVLPATMALEALAQLAGILNTYNHGCAAEMVLMLVDGVALSRPLRPGELLRLEVTMMYDHPYGATMAGRALAGDEEVLIAERIVFAHELTTDPAKIARCRERFFYQTGGYPFSEVS
jgi:3-hydroxymyristoyl/3-hydroxydecanoyl-(acyl carrier protein) dehydratase